MFSGPTICHGCDDAWISLLEERGIAVEKVGPGQTNDDVLRGVDLYVVPGGEDVQNLDDGWNELERKALRKFIRRGGRYLGACLGAYWAADWPGEHAGFESLQVVPAHVMALSPDKKAKIVPVNWHGKLRKVYFQDGPGFNLLHRKGVDVFARYENGVVASFVSKYGRGRVAVTGVHVEATEEWFDEDGLVNPGLSLDLARELLDSLLKP